MTGRHTFLIFFHGDWEQAFPMKMRKKYDCLSLSLNFNFEIVSTSNMKGSNEKLNATIDSVSKKQTIQIKEWEKENPNWNESEAGIDEYMQMISVVMGGLNDQERNKNKDLIKPRLTESIEINAQGKLKDT